MTLYSPALHSFSDSPLFGREDLLDLLLKRCTSHGMGYRQNIAVIGRPRVGKTSILVEAFRRVNGSLKNLLTLRIDLNCPPGQYYEEFALNLLTSACRRRGAAPLFTESAGLKTLLEFAAPYYPKTARHIRENSKSFGTKGLAFQLSRMMDTLQLIQTEEPLRIVFALDSFERFCEFGDSKALDALATSIMLHKDILFLLAGSDSPRVREILHSELNLLFGRPEIIEVQPLDFSTAKSFLRQMICPLGIEEPFADFLMQVSDGHPFYIQVMGRSLKARYAKDETEECLPEDIIAAMAEVLCGDLAALNVFFEGLLAAAMARGEANGFEPQMNRLLVRLASGGCRISDLGRDFSEARGLQSKCRKVLTGLVKSGLVIKDGSFYQLKDTALAFWVRTSFRVRRLENLRTESEVKRGFSQLCLKEWRAFFKDIQLPPEQRISDLIGEFRNDRIEVDSRAKTFPSLNVCSLIPSGHSHQPESFCILAENNKVKWLCVVTHQYVTENLIKSILAKHQGAERHGVGVRVVLMCLRGIHPNASLIAKEENILVLGLKCINKLLCLYGKNKIILAN